MTVVNPELTDLADRIADAERVVNEARESARALLHHLTDARLALDAVVRELHDLDDARMGASTPRPGLLAVLDGGAR